MLKSLKWFAAFIGFGLMIAYVVMIIDIIPIVHEAEAVFLNNATNDTCAFYRYSTSQYGEKVHRKAKVIPLFAFHNNHDGYVYVVYSYEVRDEAGNLLSGAKNIISKWIITNETDCWRVVSVIEKP